MKDIYCKNIAQLFGPANHQLLLFLLAIYKKEKKQMKEKQKLAHHQYENHCQGSKFAFTRNMLQ